MEYPPLNGIWMTINALLFMIINMPFNEEHWRFTEVRKEFEVAISVCSIRKMPVMSKKTDADTLNCGCGKCRTYNTGIPSASVFPWL
jgi:hypothetical protein